MREEKRILAILSFPGQRFLLSFNQFWTWLRKQGGVSRKSHSGLGSRPPVPGTTGRHQGVPLESFLSLTLGLEPDLESSTPEH